MRQTNIIRHCYDRVKHLLCTMLLVIGFITATYADVSGVAVSTNFPGDSNKINGSGYVDLSVTWMGDTPPFTAKYKVNSNIINTEAAINENSTTARIQASTIGDTGGNPVPIVVQIVDSLGKTAEASSQGVIVDTKAPTLTATITNGPTFSQSSTVRIQIVSDKEVKAPTVTCNSVNATAEGSISVGTSFVYNLPLSSSFTNGSYNINITTTDTTSPEAGANRGSTTCSFTVGTSAAGPTAIEGATPASPTNAPTISLTGSSPTGVAKVVLLDGGTEVTSLNTSETSWSMTITSVEGSHSYVAVSYDSLNQEISRSTAFTYVVDKTAPDKPTVATEGIPAQTNATSQVFSVTVENYSTEVTPPVMLQGYNNNVAVGSKYNVTSSGSPLNVTIPLSDGTNLIYFKTVDAAGNQSENSESVTINKSGSATAAVSTVLIDTYSVPAPTTSMLGTGEHNFTINFNQPVSSAEPTVSITCGGGSTITGRGTWESNTVFKGSFNIPANGGATVDGAATITVSGVKDTYGNILPEYSQAAAFSIDSTAPQSSINSSQDIYVSANRQSVTLNGTVDDGTGSGVDFLTLIIKDSTGAGTDVTQNIPLQTGAQSPWSYALDVSALGESGEYTLVTSATDKAIPTGNKESYTGKPGIKIIVDKIAPEAVRISLNNTGIDMVDESVIASDVSRIVAVASDTGSGLDLTNANYVLTLTGPEGNIAGEKTNNGINTLYFDFPTLTASGTYTVTFTPVDKAGNAGTTVTKRFSINKSAPDQAEFAPTAFAVANKTEENLAENQVKVVLSSNGSSTPSYANSTISVKYNGNEVGRQEANDTALIAKLHNGDLKTDGSHDGNYYITVVPHSTTGVTGNAITSSFVYDTQAPVITKSSPNITTTEAQWLGTGVSELYIEVSDAPKDILQYYNGQYDLTVASAPVQPGDVSWYNGSGSGINFSNSVLKWTMEGGVTSEPHTYSGSRIKVKAPQNSQVMSTASDTKGFVEVEVYAEIHDNVIKGTDVPNKLTISKTLKFDYTPPTITIGSSSGSKYQGNTLTVRGSAEDVGSDETLKVQGIEYSEDNGTTWIPINAEGLPAKNASITVKLDISSKTDGSHKVKFRATDLAGNTSGETTFTYVIDRIPPNAPELTIPLADYTVNKRTQSFKWATSNGANDYLLQISDDSSFNNILNHTANSGYPSLKGAICTTTNSSFTLPKDGNFYWRVAALEKCADGYNISEFSTTRRIAVDSVKPYILSVSPTPSSSNTVSTGMVTFNFRFSETLDPTINLTATITSAGGQVMKIEKISCTGDTWTGTTVIPKNNSSLYDGTAVISVQGAADLAGNIMTVDSSHTIVINTGPAFTTKLFSNPAHEYEITILTKASESLQTAPSVYVKQGSTKTPVTMSFLKDRFYSGAYKIDKENPGKAYITISGTDLYGMVGNSTVEFIIADANASSRMSLTTNSGSSLKAAEGSTYSPTSIYLIDRKCLESPFSGTETINSSIRASAGIRASREVKNQELVGVLGLDQVEPRSTKLKKCMLYTADLNGEVINTDHSKVHIYRQDSNGKWIFQGGTLYNYKISAQLTGLGRLALMADLTAPRMSRISPTDGEKLRTSKPEISGQFEDNGSGLNPNTFKLYIDGLQVQNVNMESNGSFRYQVDKALTPGRHQIDVEVKDNAGNSLRKSFVSTSPAFAEGEFRPYPNPARGNYIKFAYNFGANPESVSLKIYDSAGHLVAKFGTDDFGRADGKLNWDLTNKKGKRVANGTYIYRLEYVSNGQKIKRRGRLAILR